MPENTVMPIDLRALARAGSKHQRHHPENEATRHQDRPDPRPRPSISDSIIGFRSLTWCSSATSDDHDGVLR